MFLSGPLAPLMIHAAEEDASTKAKRACEVSQDDSCRVSAGIDYALHGEPGGLDWGTSFGATDPAKVGQNLYLIVYKSTQSDTLSDAIIATAAQYGMPPERMSLILGGDISPILERSPLMRFDSAVSIYNQMVETYNDKKDSLLLAATMKAKVEPNEMFADGDLANSGFDLINDLNNIEIILFKKNDLVTFGGTFDSSSEEETATSTSPTATPTTTGDLPVDLSGTSNGGQKGKGANKGGSDKTPPIDPFGSQEEDKSQALLGSINPSQCFAGDKIDRALADFSEEAAKNSKLKFRPITKIDGGPKGPTNGTKNTGGGSGTSPDVGIPTPADTVPPAAPPLQAAPPGDYTSPPLCDDIVCISLEFVMKPAVASFSKTDNCIQCHVQYIVDGMQKTISHSLIPAKASGNLGESGLCKNAAGTALGSVGMNINIAIVPMVTPAKDDLVTLGNITDEWASYAAKNGAWNYGEKERRRLEALKINKPVDTSAIPDTIERQLIIEINNAPAKASQGKVVEAARTADDKAKAEATQVQLVAEISKDAFGQVDALKALDDEMKAMNKYFEGFQKNMRTLLEDVPGIASTKACVKLNSKQVCT